MTALILTDGAPQFTIPAGDGVEIYGTAGVDSLAFAAGSNVTLDASFNAGNDVIYLEGNSTDFTVSNSGATVSFTDANGNTITLPAGTTAQTLVFGDGALDLKISDGAVMLGTQTVSGTATTVSAAVDTTTTSDSQFGGTTPADPTFSVAASAATVTEGGDAVFTVSLSEAQGTEATVAYTLAGTGGAVLGTDTTTVADATLTFAPGETTKTVTVPVTFDSTVETGEGMTLTLSDPSTGTDLGTSSAAVAFEDPAAPTFTLTSTAVAGAATTEGNTITYTITPSSVTDKAYTFTLSTAGDTLNGVATAATGADFSPAASTVSFAANSTAAQTVVQTIVADGAIEGLEGYKTTLLDSNFDAISTMTGLINDGSTSGTVGTTYTLTTLIDNVPGTSADDTIVGSGTGAATTTSAKSDQVNGGEGTDTLKIYSLTAATDLPTMSNVEVIELIDADAPVANLDLTGVTAMTGLVLDNTTTGDTYLIGSAVEATVKDMANAETVTLTSRATDTTADLTVEGLGSGGTTTVNFDGAAIATVNLTSSGTTSNNVTFASTGNETTLNVDGSAGITLVDGDVGITTFNAASATGSVTFDMSAATGTNQTLTGGSGSDTFTVDLARNITLNAGAGNDTVVFDAGTVLADLSSATGAVDSIVGGDGTDTLSMTAATADSLDGDTAADLAVITGFEQLLVNNDLNGTTVDISKFGLNYLLVGADLTTANANVNGFSSGATVEFRDANNTAAIQFALNVGMTNATNASTPDDTLNLVLNDNLVNQPTVGAANGESIQIEVGLSGINKLNVSTADRANTDGATSRDDGYTLTLTNDNNVDTITVTGSNELSFTSTASTAALSTINAAGSTGDLIVNLAVNSLSQGVTVVGSAGANTITGTADADIITGGALADTITGGQGADTMTGGTGADNFIFAAADFTATSAATLATAVDKISDFASSNDIITWDANFSIVQNGSAIGGNAAINAEGFATFAASDDTLAEQITAVEAAINATGNADGAIAIFENGANTYAFISEGTAGVGAGDALIELTGVTGLSDTTLTFATMTIA